MSLRCLSFCKTPISLSLKSCSQFGSMIFSLPSLAGQKLGQRTYILIFSNPSGVCSKLADLQGIHWHQEHEGPTCSGFSCGSGTSIQQESPTVRTDLANRPTEPMLVSFRAWYTKLWGNRRFLQSGSRQTTPVRVGVTCGSGISVVQVGRE